ncbi:hypothetical protein DPMN_134402 [Dreissena polymorpha]|uniref:Uncharacterized protein n=2 Tax=Dreissena polymorpha TaxID=45954 RepID=A0A9D4JEV3_DREPO|nr:hypothetical protein DPMN_134402 [Dreissena polymorpha]
MSIFRKLMRRKSHKIENEDVKETEQDTQNLVESKLRLDNDGDFEVEIRQPPYSMDKIKSKNSRKQLNRQSTSEDDVYGPYKPSFAEEVTEAETERESTDMTSSSSTEDETESFRLDNKTLILIDKNTRMMSKLEKLRKQRDRLKRQQNEVICMEKEIRHVIDLIARAKVDTEALKHDALMKKCELKYLASQVPEGFDMEARQKATALYRRYSHIRSLPEAKALLQHIRQKVRTLQYIELLTYNKAMEFQHGLKKASVKNAFSEMLQKNPQPLDAIVDALRRTSEASMANTTTMSALSASATTATSNITSNSDAQSGLSSTPATTTVTIESQEAAIVPTSYPDSPVVQSSPSTPQYSPCSDLSLSGHRHSRL